MPYDIRKQGDEFCVVEQDGGQVVKCHPTQEQAQAHLRALYANVADAHSEQIAIEPFKAQDWSKPFRILPLGTFFRGDRVLNITDERAQQIVKNFNAGLPRYGIVINVEHGDAKEQIGKVGTVKHVEYRHGDGIYAKETNFTDAGKKLLDEDRFDAVSPEMVWTLNDGAKYQDPITGAYHDNVLVGLALTTAPFFGSSVQVFSANRNSRWQTLAPPARAGVADGRWQEQFDDVGLSDVHVEGAMNTETQKTKGRAEKKKSDEYAEGDAMAPVHEHLSKILSLLQSLADKVGGIKDAEDKEQESEKARARINAENFGEWDTAYINDLPDSAFAVISTGGKKDADGKTVPRSLRHLPYKDKDGKMDLPHLRNALARLDQADVSDEEKGKARGKLEAAAKSNDVGDYGKEKSSAGARGEHFMDHNEMIDHHDNNGKPHADKIKAALDKKDLSDDEKGHLQNHLKEMASATHSGGETMADPITVTPEKFAELERKANEVDEFKAKLETAEAARLKLAEDFAAERHLRQRAEFVKKAEAFKSVPAKTDELGDQLLWLFNTDASDKKEHYSFFEKLIDVSSRALSQSALFKAMGNGQPSDENAGEQHPFLAKAEEIRVQRFKDDGYAVGFSKAFKVAGDEHKDLARDYAFAVRGK